MIAAHAGEVIAAQATAGGKTSRMRFGIGWRPAAARLASWLVGRLRAGGSATVIGGLISTSCAVSPWQVFRLGCGCVTEPNMCTEVYRYVYHDHAGPGGSH